MSKNFWEYVKEFVKNRDIGPSSPLKFLIQISPDKYKVGNINDIFFIFDTKDKKFKINSMSAVYEDGGKFSFTKESAPSVFSKFMFLDS